MPDATDVVVDAGFGRADLTAFCRLDEPELEVTGQRLGSDRAILACRVVEPADSDERWCRRCCPEGAPRDSVVRRLAHEPFGPCSPVPVRADVIQAEVGDLYVVLERSAAP